MHTTPPSTLAADQLAATPVALDHRPRHLPALDGLRGSAILAVLTCHYASLLSQSSLIAGVLTFGWAGVDLFFVLSGFLITGILFDAKGHPHYYRNFYARRFLRIVPLYVAFLAALLLVLLAAKSFIPLGASARQDLDQLARYQPWLWTYTVNFKLAFQRDWGPWLDTIVPLWSLAVEEQFYLVWPIVVAAFSRRALVRICLAVLTGALLTRFALTAAGVHFFTTYTLTPTRADSLAAGCLLALLIRAPGGIPRARRLSKYTGATAIALVLLGSSGFDPLHHPYLRDLLYTTLAVAFASVLFWSTDPTSLAGLPHRFYSSHLLRTTGRYAYGLYLFHLPLLNLTRELALRRGLYTPGHWPPALALIAANLILIFALAINSFHLFETRFLNLKRYYPRATP